MAKLDRQHKVFIVERLACFYTPTEIQTELQEVHDVKVSLSQVAFYDPDGAQGSRELSQELRDIHKRVRDAFLEHTERIPIANKAYRLQELQKLYRKAKNPKSAAAFLEQAAKESGGQYTNKSEVTLLGKLAQ